MAKKKKEKKGGKRMKKRELAELLVTFFPHKTRDQFWLKADFRKPESHYAPIEDALR